MEIDNENNNNNNIINDEEEINNAQKENEENENENENEYENNIDDEEEEIPNELLNEKLDIIMKKLEDINIEKGKYYARAIVENDADNSVCRWVSYDAFNSLEEAKARIEEIKGDFKTYFDYVETADDNGKCVPYYENNVDVLGNVKYWDQPNTNNRR